MKTVRRTGNSRNACRFGLAATGRHQVTDMRDSELNFVEKSLTRGDDQPPRVALPCFGNRLVYFACAKRALGSQFVFTIVAVQFIGSF